MYSLERTLNSAVVGTGTSKTNNFDQTDSLEKSHKLVQSVITTN